MLMALRTPESRCMLPEACPAEPIIHRVKHLVDRAADASSELTAALTELSAVLKAC